MLRTTPWYLQQAVGYFGWFDTPLPAWAYQVLFVNKRIAIVERSAPSPYLPHPLDAPDYSLGGDCQINGRIGESQ